MDRREILLLQLIADGASMAGIQSLHVQDVATKAADGARYCALDSIPGRCAVQRRATRIPITKTLQAIIEDYLNAPYTDGDPFRAFRPPFTTWLFPSGVRGGRCIERRTISYILQKLNGDTPIWGPTTNKKTSVIPICVSLP